MNAGDRAWLRLALDVVFWDITCPEHETLSEACARYRTRHPAVTTAVVGYLAGHLLGVWPQRYDPLHIASAWKRSLARRG